MINLQQVLEFAKEKHSGQTRKSGEPYIIHPVRVGEIVREVEKGNAGCDILIAAALLHDTLEDTYTSYVELENLFGRVVAGVVVELTSSSYASDFLGKAKYMCSHMLHMTPSALTVKLADRLDNISDMKGFTPERQKTYAAETSEIIDFIINNRELTDTQKQLVERIKAILQVKG